MPFKPIPQGPMKRKTIHQANAYLKMAFCNRLKPLSVTLPKHTNPRTESPEKQNDKHKFPIEADILNNTPMEEPYLVLEHGNLNDPSGKIKIKTQPNNNTPGKIYPETISCAKNDTN